MAVPGPRSTAPRANAKLRSLVRSPGRASNIFFTISARSGINGNLFGSCNPRVARSGRDLRLANGKKKVCFITGHRPISPVGQVLFVCSKLLCYVEKVNHVYYRFRCIHSIVLSPAVLSTCTSCKTIKFGFSEKSNFS